jgi:hypothetical protein
VLCFVLGVDWFIALSFLSANFQINNNASLPCGSIRYTPAFRLGVTDMIKGVSAFALIAFIGGHAPANAQYNSPLGSSYGSSPLGNNHGSSPLSNYGSSSFNSGYGSSSYGASSYANTYKPTYDFNSSTPTFGSSSYGTSSFGATRKTSPLGSNYGSSPLSTASSYDSNYDSSGLYNSTSKRKLTYSNDFGNTALRENPVHVNGYYRQNGTYVEPYNRTSPNNTTIDNYSTAGNMNPYTGQSGQKSQWKSLGSRMKSWVGLK